MTDKPQIKREVGIKSWNNNMKVIFLNASPDAANDLGEFGRVNHHGGSVYALYVDSRFDFDEILEYVRNYG